MNPPRKLTQKEIDEGFHWELIEEEWELIRPYKPEDEAHPLLKEFLASSYD